MEIRTITFNDVNFSELGLLLTKTPVPPCSRKDFETIAIPSGNTLILEKDTYQPIQFSIECLVIEQGRLRDIYDLIQTSGRLILPDEPNKYYNAVLTISTPQNLIMYYNKIVFNVVAEPCAYLVDDKYEMYELSTYGSYQGAYVTNYGTSFCEPIYKIGASETFDLYAWQTDPYKNFRINLAQADIVTIDVQKMLIWNSAGDMILSQTKGDFNNLRLNPGQNFVRGTHITSLKILKNERWH